MLVTGIRVRAIPNGKGLVGSVDLTLSKMLVVRNIKIIKNTNLDGKKYFLGMPRILVKNNFLETINPISNEVRDSFEKLVFAAFNYLQENNYHRVIFNYDETHAKLSLLEQDFTDYFVEGFDLAIDKN